MIINKMLSDQVVAYWEYIKFAAVSANNMKDSKHLNDFCKNLLCNILSGKCQCWLGIDNNKEQIKGIAITKIYKDVGDIQRLLIDTLYVYDTTELRDRLQFIDKLKEFGKELNCTSIIFYTNNQSLINVAEKIGFEESYRVYKIDLGGV